MEWDTFLSGWLSAKVCWSSVLISMLRLWWLPSGVKSCLDQDREQCPMARMPPYGWERRVCSYGRFCAIKLKYQKVAVSYVHVDHLSTARKQIKTGSIFHLEHLIFDSVGFVALCKGCYITALSVIDPISWFAGLQLSLFCIWRVPEILCCKLWLKDKVQWWKPL